MFELIHYQAPERQAAGVRPAGNPAFLVLWFTELLANIFVVSCGSHFHKEQFKQFPGQTPTPGKCELLRDA